MKRLLTLLTIMVLAIIVTREDSIGMYTDSYHGASLSRSNRLIVKLANDVTIKPKKVGGSAALTGIESIDQLHKKHHVTAVTPRRRENTPT